MLGLDLHARTLRCRHRSARQKQVTFILVACRARRRRRQVSSHYPTHVANYILKHGLSVLTRLGVHTDAYGCKVGARENDELVALARARGHQRSKEFPKTGLAIFLLHTVTPLTASFFLRRSPLGQGACWPAEMAR
jgi:hypothetical protein